MIINNFKDHYIIFPETAKMVDIFRKKRYNKVKPP